MALGTFHIRRLWQQNATGRSTRRSSKLPGGHMGLTDRSIWTSSEVPSGSMVVDFTLTSSEALLRQQKEMKGHVFAPLRTEEGTASIQKIWEPFWVFDAECQLNLNLNLNLNLYRRQRQV